ncbi:hypothetical protein IscW_ISCW005479 [Ixodes scapularis]|uniref:GST N-terminal domain-containing protein n=1 Tax=Ixodes scapularis TaxID=6945 RepID=B7PPX3_IXOSC|nr:hypothetical protein IscW_ISCW005479 [Ixodes scapularis]|eukprot:XP_002435815.1 hypothetical protein IscW_ISCW005479 [Ixodes scapularis]
MGKTSTEFSESTKRFPAHLSGAVVAGGRVCPVLLVDGRGPSLPIARSTSEKFAQSRKADVIAAMAPVLGYWDIRGLAQYIRYLLAHAGVQYEDKRGSADRAKQRGDFYIDFFGEMATSEVVRHID